MEKNELLVCRDVSLGYKASPILEHLNLTVHTGDYLCVIGENRSGKSTLIRTLLGLLPPLSGKIERAPEIRRGAIGYLPQQQAQAQSSATATVNEVVMSGFLNQKGIHLFFTSAQKSQALTNMDKTGILELKDRCCRELSGGQQQRVQLARALCAASRLLVLDEPVIGLDPAAAQELYKILARLNRQEGIAVIMVTHDLARALQSAKTVLRVGHDSWFYGSTQAYLRSPQSRRCGKKQDA